MSEWTPPSWWYTETKPPNDEAYFENLTRCIFQAGLNWQVITNKWPHFKDAFHNFNIAEIASFDAEDTERLVTNAQIVRNRRKILATIFNAQAFTKIAEEFGSFKQWLEQVDKANNYAMVVTQLRARLKHVGKMTAHTFLHSVGEDIQYDSGVYGGRHS